MYAGCAGAVPEQQASVSGGEQLFARACARCHAEDGSGGLPMAAGGPRPVDLRALDWQTSRSDDEIVAAIRDGRGAMPPFEGVLTDDEILELTRYVRRIGNRARP